VWCFRRGFIRPERNRRLCHGRRLHRYGGAGCGAAGGSIDRLAILDNYCWCDSTNPLRLGQLKASAQACYDYAVAYRTPFVSGKDSMFNDFKGYDEES
jgi:hypothetical protein